MKSGWKPSDELSDLIEALCHDDIASEQAVRLEQLVLSDLQVRQYYVRYLHLHASLGQVLPTHSVVTTSLPVFGDTILSTTVPGTVGWFSSGWPVAYLIATVICGVSLLIGSLTPVSQPEQFAGQSSVPSRVDVEPKIEPVGRITGMVDCRWADPSKAPGGYDHVSLRRRFELESGLMEITYDTGAKIILQGPAIYTVESAAGGYLSLGKLAARVEKEAAVSNHQSSIINHQLFAVRTPTATVTDLGTEFGVEVDKQGCVTAHVFRGKVKCVPTSGGREDEKNAVVLRENESVRTEKPQNVQGAVVVIRRAAADPKVFVRQLVDLPTTLDLLDIVAGGNGRGHRRERGIDPTTGMEDASYAAISRSSGGAYHRVDWNRMIDGVFVPKATKGTFVVLDSAGHAFNGFPATRGWTWGSIWARAADLPRNDLVNNHAYCYAMGRCDQFMPQGRGVLFLQPSVGITFNLGAIRRAHPSVRPTAFCAVAGLADCSLHPSLNKQEKKIFSKKPHNVANIWVFVDGRAAFTRMDLQPKDGAIPVHVDLGPNDAFLTLVSINDCGAAWFVFGDPVLETSNPDISKKKP